MWVNGEVKLPLSSFEIVELGSSNGELSWEEDKRTDYKPIDYSLPDYSIPSFKPDTGDVNQLSRLKRLSNKD